MKKLLLYFLFLSSTALAQSSFYNDVVRSNNLSPRNVANAVDVSKPLSSSGTNTYTFSLPFTGFTYHTGDVYTLVFVNANSSTTVTANIGALGALAIKGADGNDLSSGDLKAGGAYKFYNNGTHLRLIGSAGSGAYLPLTLTGTTDVNGAQTLRFGNTTPLTGWSLLTSGSQIFTVGNDYMLTVVDDWVINGVTPTTRQIIGNVNGTPTWQADKGSFNHLTPNIQTADYTATAADTIKLIYFRHLTTPMVLTLPNTSVLPVGSMIAVMRDTLAGVTIVGASGVDVIGTATLASQKEVAVFHHRETNKWVRVGTQSSGSSSVTAGGATGDIQYKSAGGGLQAEAAAHYDSATNTATFGNLSMPSGAVLNFNSSDVTVTHSSNALTVAGGEFNVVTEAYDASGWNGDNGAPTKDAVRDKIETIAIGTQNLNVSATAMWPRVTGGCSQLTRTEVATSLFNIQTLDFDQSTDEFAQFQIVLPAKWNNGTVTAIFYWTTSASSGNVIWGIQGGAYSDDDALSTAFGTEQTVTDGFLLANDVHVSSATSAITLAGTPADADFLAFQVHRDADNGSDTLNGDAKLLTVKIILTTDASTD